MPLQQFPPHIPHLELAQLCNDSYHPGRVTPPDWEIADQFYDDLAFGIGAAIYVNHTLRCVFLCFRGTDNDENMRANRLLAFGFRPQQAEADAHFILRYAERKQRELNDVRVKKGKDVKVGSTGKENEDMGSIGMFGDLLVGSLILFSSSFLCVFHLGSSSSSKPHNDPSSSKLKDLVYSVTRDVTEKDSKPNPLIFATLAGSSNPKTITGLFSETGK